MWSSLWLEEREATTQLRRQEPATESAWRPRGPWPWAQKPRAESAVALLEPCRGRRPGRPRRPGSSGGPCLFREQASSPRHSRGEQNDHICLGFSRWVSIVIIIRGLLGLALCRAAYWILGVQRPSLISVLMDFTFFPGVRDTCFTPVFQRGPGSPLLPQDPLEATLAPFLRERRDA